MPGKHHGESFTSRHRYPLVLAVVLLGITVAGFLAAVRDPQTATPLLITPALPPPLSPSAPAAPLATTAPPPSPSPSASSSRPASRAGSAARSPSRRPGPSPSATGGSFTADYTVMGGPRTSLRAAISVTNEGRAARSWRVVVTHDPDDEVRLDGTIGARATTAGDTITFQGDALGPGDSVTFGYQASTRARDVARPTSCRVDGVECRVTLERWRR
jgi:hypothetical protein